MAEEVKINDGGPAFPVLKQNAFGKVEAQVQGMTLRDWFAGQALAGFCANSSKEFENKDPDSLADIAWEQADYMIAARLPTSTDVRETR